MGEIQWFSRDAGDWVRIGDAPDEATARAWIAEMAARAGREAGEFRFVRRVQFREFL